MRPSSSVRACLAPGAARSLVWFAAMTRSDLDGEMLGHRLLALGAVVDDPAEDIELRHIPRRTNPAGTRLEYAVLDGRGEFLRARLVE